MTSSEKKSELRIRTKEFASQIIRFFISLDKRWEELRIIGKQLPRSVTSVAANYREASRARSAEEVIAKIEICSQEADKTQLWLELLRDDCGISPILTNPIWEEADELIRMFVTMSKNTQQR